MKLYKGDECFELFKQCYYKYCSYTKTQLINTINKLYDKMEYANDYYGINVKTLSRLIYMHDQYKEQANNFNNKFWFEIFIKGIFVKIY